MNRADLRGAHAACLRVIEIDPRHADAHFLLGMVALASGNVAKAHELVARAIGLDGGRADYHAQLARCLALLSRHEEARAAVASALELGARDALTLDTIGVALSRLGDHERAAAAFEAAVALAPRNAGFQYNLAASLRFLGRFAAAEEAYEAALAADPSFHCAHSALAELRRQSRQNNHIRRLTGALARVGADVDAELHVRYALAKEHEDIGDYAAAFAHLTAGKAKKRRALGYTGAEDRALFAQIRAAFDAARLAGAEETGDPSEAPIFVIGMPRTGTTLVERILSSHSAVATVGESQNFALCVKRAAGTASSRVLDEATLAAAFAADRGALGRRYLESTRPTEPPAQRFVDKMPLNFFYVGFIHGALPNAKIVCLRRNPLDTCLSNFRQLFALDFSYYDYAYDLSDIGRYYVLFDELMRHWHAVLPGRILDVEYERLVTRQEPETRRLLEFCGLPFEQACLRFQENPAPVATASAVQVREPLNAASIGRWRRYARELEPLRAELVAAGVHLAP